PTTPASRPAPLFSAAASTTVSHEGGGGSSGGGGTTRATPFPPSPAPSNAHTPLSPTSAVHTSSGVPALGYAGNGNGNGNSHAGQLSKIVIAQVFLLLSTIKEDKDRTKWDSQAEQIRKLIESNGMEVFPKYFRRLLVGNSPQIFPGINKAVENPGNYPLLEGELRKITHDPEQARRIADAIDTADGDLFKNFDLATFIDHFKLTSVETVLLALAFESSARPDLSTKADAILANIFPRLIDDLSSSASAEESTDLPDTLVARTIDALAQHPPPVLNEDGKSRLVQAIHARYQNVSAGLPTDVAMALQLLDLLGPHQQYALALQRAGPSSTSSREACENLLQSLGRLRPDEELIAGALLFMITSQQWQLYQPAIFVEVMREGHGPIRWQKVLHCLDRDGLQIDVPRFLRLYNALLPVARADPRFDLQLLWGGKWRHAETQLSFVTAFVQADSDALDVTAIPRLRPSFTVADFDTAPNEVREYATRAVTHPLVSLDAVLALFDLILYDSDSVTTSVNRRIFAEIVQANVDVFIAAAVKVPKPWTNTQQEIVSRLFLPFILQQHPQYDFVLHYAWKQDKQWVAMRLVEVHVQDPMKLPVLLDHAEQHGWLADLLQLLNGLGVDLAALAHRRGILDIEQWARSNGERAPGELATVIGRFLQIKAEDELKVTRHEQSGPRTISLAVKTVKAFSRMLERLTPEDRLEEFASIERLIVQVYPRLINYGEGFDDIIDANDEETRAFPASVDELMQEHYRALFAENREVDDMVDALATYKQSRDPVDQDLFACMIHALFDEFSCYQGYRLSALARTAVLFGGIIKLGLISTLPLRVAMSMVLEALRDHQPDTPMFTFGRQALVHFCERLHEWPSYAACLLQIPGLEGTEVWRGVVQAASGMEQRTTGSEDGVNVNGLPPDDAGMPTTNGVVSDAVPPAAPPPFHCIHVEPSRRAETFESPSEDVQDAVLFLLNNLSEQNLEPKSHDIAETLQEKHHDWFAGYLVEERARVQPNYHQLYLDLLGRFANRELYDEVLRHTYISIIRGLNAPSTLESSVERTYLKNLATWLGSLTLARDKPIKFKNISFKDLLIEAYDTQRLIIAIPFTCKVLAQGSRSAIFKPPNPWVMEIIGLLIELYHFADLRLQLKFEVEVVCQDLGLDHRSLEPSFTLRERPQHDEELSAPTIPDGLDAFEELSLTAIGRASTRSHRYSSSSITASLPDFRRMLVYPPTSTININRETLEYIVENAVRRAIMEIITPVVERSVVIASIATAQLIQKDFATEPDEDRVRQSATTMVKALAGSLALVTCKEPLRMSMTNNIRVLSAEADEQALPEGAILMCVNDNLDTACSLVEGAAEMRALPDIEEHIENQLEIRRQHRDSGTTDPFNDPNLTRWSYMIPEPYRLTPNLALNREQMAVYEAFQRESRTVASHEPSSSTDSGRHLVNDVLQEQFPAIPNLPTPAEPPSVPFEEAPQQQLQRVQQGQPMASPLAGVPQSNGYPHPKDVSGQIQECLFELQRATREATVDHLAELPSDSPIFEIHHQTARLIATSPQRHQLAAMTARRLYDALYTQTEKVLEVEVLAHLLKEMSDMSAMTARELTVTMAKQDEELMFNAPVVVSLLDTGLLDFHRVDTMISKALYQHNPASVDFLTEIMDQTLFSDRPIALRADFAASTDALSQWLTQEPNLAPAEQLLQKLQEPQPVRAADDVPEQPMLHRRRQIEYAFTEWTRLCARPDATDKIFAAFIAQMHRQHLLKDEESSCMFFRLCIDMAVQSFEETLADPTARFGDAFLPIDALAKLIVLLVKFKTTDEATEEDVSKASYLHSILSLTVLVLNHHHVVRGESFNQRVFFRLYSSFFCEFQLRNGQFDEQEKDMLLVVSKTILALQPLHFPSFIFGWLSLVSHRFFLPDMLLLPDQAGWESYASIIEAMLGYIGELLKGLTASVTTKELYRGLLRILLMLHHDFPEFLAEHHHKLCTAIPAHCTQLRNLILSAHPSAYPDLPDPFRVGLIIDHVSEIRIPPSILENFEEPLYRANIRQAIDNALAGKQLDENVLSITEAIMNPSKMDTGIAYIPIPVDRSLVHALVLYVGTHALATTDQKGGIGLNPDSPELVFFLRLIQNLPGEGRYYLLSAMANQLRYPNSHTHYFSCALLCLFAIEGVDQPETYLRQQITRVLLERLIVHRPHPWGLIITLLELLKNQRYLFWDLKFIKEAPEVSQFLYGFLQQCEYS
ncbi:MAG: Histone deacetylase hda1, partial [Watsoniomyces obsoletus]